MNHFVTLGFVLLLADQRRLRDVCLLPGTELPFDDDVQYETRHVPNYHCSARPKWWRGRNCTIRCAKLKHNTKGD